MWTCIECENHFDSSSGDLDERMCNNCMDGEEEYEVKVSGCFTVVAESQESANRFIRNQLEDGVSSYTCDLEVGNE